MAYNKGVRVAKCPIGLKYCHPSCKFRKGDRCCFRSKRGRQIPELEKASRNSAGKGRIKMISTVIRCQNDMVLVFDKEGKQIPEYQGEYHKVRQSILRDTLLDTVFAHGFTTYGELRKIAREEW